MKINGVFGAAILLAVLSSVFALTLSASHAMTMECANASQREASVNELTSDIDWFLSIVEEVPAGVAQQLRAIDVTDNRAIRNAMSHPLWKANKIRDAAADIKDKLAPTLTQTPDRRIKQAIRALGNSAFFVRLLSEYADKNPGRRIVDVQQWAIKYSLVAHQLEHFALCLVDNRQ